MTNSLKLHKRVTEEQTCSHKWLLRRGAMTHKTHDGVWITGDAYLYSLESGGVIVCKLLEDVSRSKAERAQAVQDGSLEAWPKSIFKYSTLKYEWDQSTSFDLKSQGEIESWPKSAKAFLMKNGYLRTLTSHGGKAGVYMKRVPVAAQTVQGRL